MADSNKVRTNHATWGQIIRENVPGGASIRARKKRRRAEKFDQMKKKKGNG